MSELREGLQRETPSPAWSPELFHNEKGKTGELAGGSFAPIAGLSPELALDGEI